MISTRHCLPTLLAQFTVLLRRHADKLAEGVIKTAAGSESGSQCDVENGFIGIAKQCADVIDPHGGDVLLHGELHHALENPHRVVGIELHVLRNVVDSKRLIVVISNKAQHLADVKLGMP